jgi:hypothetical protein
MLSNPSSISLISHFLPYVFNIATLAFYSPLINENWSHHNDFTCSLPNFFNLAYFTPSSLRLEYYHFSFYLFTTLPH